MFGRDILEQFCCKASSRAAVQRRDVPSARPAVPALRSARGTRAFEDVEQSLFSVDYQSRVLKSRIAVKQLLVAEFVLPTLYFFLGEDRVS